MTGPDPFDLWVQAHGNPDLYRYLSVAAAETEPYPCLPHEPGGEHCGVGGAPKPERPHYRRCSCGLWYCWTGSLWRPGRPSAQWLREHGMDDPEGFLGYDPEPGRSVFGEFFTSVGGWRYVLHWLLRR